MTSKASIKRAAKLIKTYERMMKLWESFTRAQSAFDRARDALSRPYRSPEGWDEYNWDRDALEIADKAGYGNLAKARIDDLLA
jgi:hypothetical protein